MWELKLQPVSVPVNTNNANNYQGDDAARYDQQYAEHGCHGHEVLFGLMYEFIKPNETLLDIGIGTGISSFLFHRAGLQISGLDFSKEMLDVCESKGFGMHRHLHHHHYHQQ